MGSCRARPRPAARRVQRAGWWGRHPRITSTCGRRPVGRRQHSRDYREQPAPVLEHLVGGAGDPAGSASGPALPPFCSLTEKVEPNSTHHTACRRGEDDTFCDAALLIAAAARGWSQLGLRRTMAPPPYRPRRNLGWRAGGGATHAPRTTSSADGRQAHIPPGASVGSALGCAVLDTSGSGPPRGNADGLAVLASAAVPSPAPSHRLSPSLWVPDPLTAASIATRLPIDY